MNKNLSICFINISKYKKMLKMNRMFWLIRIISNNESNMWNIRFIYRLIQIGIISFYFICKILKNNVFMFFYFVNTIISIIYNNEGISVGKSICKKYSIWVWINFPYQQDVSMSINNNGTIIF